MNMNFNPKKGLVPHTMRNLTTLAGILFFLLGVIISIFFLLTDVFAKSKTSYSDLIPIVIIPVCLFFAVLLIPLGMWSYRKKMRRMGGQFPKHLVLDLNNPRHYNGVLMFGAFFFILLTVTITVGFRGYEFTESVQFCGEVCHKVMSPQLTAYKNSPHAKVKCVECHVGEGADYYVKSKMAGMYQVYSVLFHKYPQPILPPVTSLRPAQETCENCHWPDNFFAATQKTFRYFLKDGDNTEWNLTMLIRTGGGHSKIGEEYGIHLHMNIENKIEYKALDKNRQVVPWVRVTNKRTGKEKTFVSSDAPSGKELEKLETRVMDCMDCHNRPAHLFNSPETAVNAALARGSMDVKIPDIVSQSIAAINETYTNRLDPKEGIGKRLTEYYEKEYPEVAAEDGKGLEKTVKTAETIYKNNYFPYMRVDWTVYPDNIGHRDFPGCFRCHDDLHELKDGTVLTRKCDTCHQIISQGPLGEQEFRQGSEALEFNHPEEIGGAWEFTLCTDCHAPEPSYKSEEGGRGEEPENKSAED